MNRLREYLKRLVREALDDRETAQQTQMRHVLAVRDDLAEHYGVPAEQVEMRRRPDGHLVAVVCVPTPFAVARVAPPEGGGN